MKTSECVEIVDQWNKATGFSDCCLYIDSFDPMIIKYKDQILLSKDYTVFEKPLIVINEMNGHEFIMDIIQGIFDLIQRLQTEEPQ